MRPPLHPIFNVTSPTGATVSRYFHTLRHLRLSQFWYLLAHRVGQKAIRKPPPDVSSRRVGLQRPLFPSDERVCTGEIAFLNDPEIVDPECVDWRSDGQSVLWQYNLHYFDYLGNRSLEASQSAALIDSWIRDNPVGTPIAWDPYPVSLRIVNWIKHILRSDREEITHDAWLQSLWEQAIWLEENLERHLLANHLLKNAKALVFAGTFFGGDKADAWIREGVELMISEGEEQILEDGGHIERSPMYHGIVLEDYLDAVSILSANLERCDLESALPRLREFSSRMMHFLAKILTPVNTFPLFNDSADGIALPPTKLLEQGGRILGRQSDSPMDEAGPVLLEASGYFGYRDEGDYLMVDCGPLGPDYQPGHGHCDCLSYELWFDGIPIVVDSGVSDYEVGAVRQYVRSTGAHNTVRVDNAEQSEIWGAFRVARRAKPILCEASLRDDSVFEFLGSHDGYRRLAGRPVHERRVCFSGADHLEITDRVVGRQHHRIESFIHLHPDLTVEQQGDAEFRVALGERAIAKLSILSDCNATIVDGIQCPEFGRCCPNKVIVLRIDGELPVRISYSIHKAATVAQLS